VSRVGTVTKRAKPGLPTALALFGITLVALALRLPSFTDSLFGDELSTNFVVNGFGAGSFLHIIEGDQEGTPPLFFALTALTKGLGGVEGLRVVSLVACLTSIPLIYLLGLRTIGTQAGIVAAALVALSPFQIFYSTEARAYALAMALIIVVSLTLVEAVRGERRVCWVAFALAMAAAVYTHYTVIFALIGLLAWAFFAYPDRRRPLILSTLGAVLLFAAWLPQFLADTDQPASKVIEILAPLTFSYAHHDLVHLYIGHPYIPADVVPGRLGAWMIAAGLIIGLGALLLRRRSERSWPWPPANIALLLVLMLSPPVGAILHNLIAPSVFASRNLITSWPGFALLVGALVTSGRGPIRILATGLLVAGFAIGAAKMLDEDHQRPDLKDAVAFIDRVGEPDSPVVEIPLPSPGIQSPLEAALAPQGKGVPTSRSVFPVGYPTFAVRLDEAKDGHVALLPPIPAVPREEEIARQAAREAGTGKLFLVNPGMSTLAELSAVPGPAASLLAALPPRFREVEFRIFPGLGDAQVSVHMLEGRAWPPR
jgi:dolichyl-phosphate-mannose-protein mannosyltransferase